MNTQKILIGLAVVVVLALGVTFPRGKTVVERVVQQLGAVPTLDGVDSPFTSIGGTRTAYITQNLLATSSTICSVRNPFATSSLNVISVRITSGILGTNNYSVSTSTNTYATSTSVLVYDNVVTENLGDTMVWYPNASTTHPRVLPSFAFNGESTSVVRPGEYVNVRLSTTTGATDLAAYYKGTCSVEFRQI